MCYSAQSSIVCFYEGSKVTYFSAQWEFDSVQKVWNILYTEQEWKDAPSGKPHLENNINSFKSVLSEIKELAHKNLNEIFLQHPENDLLLELQYIYYWL